MNQNDENPAETDPGAPIMAAVGSVSTMTASRALKGNASIAKNTLARIRAAVDQLGYVLDQSAGSLSSRRSSFIATIIPPIDNSNFADTSRGMTDALAGTVMQILMG